MSRPINPSSAPSHTLTNMSQSISLNTPPHAAGFIPVHASVSRYQTPEDFFTAHLTKNWVPHPLSSREFNVNRLDCSRLLAIIRNLEATQSRSAPAHNPEIERALFFSRIHYKVRFWRTFRLNDLPTEIITNIFRYVVWSSINPSEDINGRLWLTWTCRHWRAVALEDSTLWSGIWFRDLPPFERSFTWINRAGVTPLDIRINDQEGHQFNDREMGVLLDKLFTKLPYIRMLIIIVKDWAPVLVVLD